MKSVLDSLSAKEKEALALLYDTEGYTALKKLHRLSVQGLGKDALAAPDLETVRFLAGRARQSKITLDLIREIYLQVNKSDA